MPYSAGQDRELGTHPTTGFAVRLRTGPYGPFVEMDAADPGSKPVRASLPPDLLPESEITLETAVDLLQWPKVRIELCLDTVLCGLQIHNHYSTVILPGIAFHTHRATLNERVFWDCFLTS